MEHVLLWHGKENGIYALRIRHIPNTMEVAFGVEIEEEEYLGYDKAWVVGRDFRVCNGDLSQILYHAQYRIEHPKVDHWSD